MKDLITFTGGLDFDSDIRNVGEVDYIDALNISSGTSQRGSVHNMYGNKIQGYILPTGANTCIGSLRNIKENSIIYFVYNSLENHSILEYLCETKTIRPILAPFTAGLLTFSTSFLGFTKDNKIHSANILDNILTWTDNNVSPRKINKKRAYDFMQQLTPSATNIPYNNLIATGSDVQKIQFIEFIKYKPAAEPFAGLGYNSARATNYIRNKMIQVKYRYIYDDNEYSRWSDGSWVILPQGTETYLGLNSNTVANNKVIVTLNTGHPTVKAIDVAFRFGNTGIWGRLDTPIYKYDNDNQRLIDDYINYEYDFYNDGVLVELADDFNNYDAVPQISKTQEVIDGNRQVFANNVEGYENPDSSVAVAYNNSIVELGLGVLDLPARTFDPEKFTTSVVVLSAPTTGDRGHLQNIPSASIREQAICVPTNPGLVVAGTVVTFKLILTTDSSFSTTTEYSIAYTIVENDLLNWPLNIHESLKNAIVAVANPAFIRTGTMTITVSGTPTSVNYISVQSEILSPWPDPPKQYAAIESFAVIKPLEKITSFKKGAWHSFGIIYKDRQGRDGGVLSNQSFNVYNPYLPEILSAQTTLDNTLAYQSRMDLTISHQPPEWAVEYEIVYALNNLKKYTQFVIKQSADAIKNLTKADSHGNYSIDCSYIIDYITKERLVTSVDFQFEEGDYLRFISSSEYYATTYIECKVLAFDPTKNILTVTGYSTAQVTAGMTTPTQNGTLCELFSYKNQAAQDNRPYFSIGQTYSISNPGTPSRAHRANAQNQNGLTPAILRLNRGDCYIYKRYFDNASIETVVESENFSDFYESKNIDTSAVYAVIPEGKTKRYEQGLRYGGRYFPNTNTNDLCQFNGSDYDTVNTRYGPINKIASVGYTLKVLQTKKNTSIYIDRNMIYNANGDSQLTLTDKVLGNKNPSELDYGCDHPESVCVDDRQLYFFDVNTGAFIQDSANGMMPISDYKAKTYFRNIAQKIKDTSGVYIYCAMDVFNAYLTVTLIDTTGAIIPNQTIAYHTMDNRWKTMLGYTPEYYGSNALTLVSFRDGALWEHHDPSVPRNNFYGVQQSTKVKFVANQDYLTIKNYASIAIYSNKLWSSPVVGDIKIPASTGYPVGMSSRLLPSRFRWKESVAYADYARDANTPNFPTVESALMGGRKLRGQVLIQEVQNSDTDEAVLYSVLISSVASPLSK